MDIFHIAETGDIELLRFVDPLLFLQVVFMHSQHFSACLWLAVSMSTSSTRASRQHCTLHAHTRLPVLSFLLSFSTQTSTLRPKVCGIEPRSQVLSCYRSHAADVDGLTALSQACGCVRSGAVISSLISQGAEHLLCMLCARYSMCSECIDARVDISFHHIAGQPSRCGHADARKRTEVLLEGQQGMERNALGCMVACISFLAEFGYVTVFE
jgi:hypothetical protein